MVGRWNSDVAEILGGIESLGIVLAKFLERTLALLVEIAVLVTLLPLAPWSLAVEEQGGIAFETKMNVEIDVETSRDGLLRISPLRNQDGLRILLILPGTHLIPELGNLLLVGVVLDKR